MELSRLAVLAVVAVSCRAPAPAPRAATQRMPEITATRKVAALSAAGLDATQLPELAAIDRAAMKPLMATFEDSLDACCEDCHVKGDPEAPTVAKAISIEMWHRYARDLVTLDGSPVYCDSCHQGKLRFLDRHDRDALSRWMLANYVRKLRLRDGSRVECFTCHGKPFEPKIFEKLWHARKG